MGKFTHAIDAKNRLIIPSKIKDQLGLKITMLKGTDKCLTLYSEAEWARYAAKISALPTTQSRALTRYLYSNAIELTPDSQGRVLMPQDMLDHAGITKDVITVGCGNYAEIWSAERWTEGSYDEQPEDYAAALEALGL